MQVKSKADDFDKILKNYLYDGETIEYSTQSDPQIMIEKFIFLIKLLGIILIIFIFCMIFTLPGFNWQLLPFILFWGCVLFILNKKKSNILTVYLPDYYFITNCRIIAYVNEFKSVNYKFSEIKLSPKLKVTMSGKYSISFSRYCDIVTFCDIPDAQVVYNIVKGKIQK